MGFTETLNDLHRRIFEDPDADAPRIAYAQHVGSREPVRGELIRLQVERFAGDLRARRWRSQPSQRERDLLDQHGDDWAQLVAPYGRTGIPFPPYEFHRGFVELLRTEAATFVELGEDLLRLGPIRHLALGADGTPLDLVLAQPALRYLRSLELGYWEMGDAGAAAVASCPYLGGLVLLGLQDNHIGEPGVSALCATPWVRGLRSVDLRDNPMPMATIAVDEWIMDGEGGGKHEPTELGQRLEAQHGPIPWLHADSTLGADRYHMPHLPPWRP